MNPTINTLNALTDWVTQTRALSRQVDHQADSLTINLQRIKSRSRCVNALYQQPLTLGFYGHAQAGKNHLLAALQRPANERIEIMLGDKSFDYLTHINPGNTPTSMAVRFSQTPPSVELPQYPLRLALLSECELVYLFIKDYLQSSDSRTLLPSLISQRLSELETRCQADPPDTDYEEDIARVLQEYRRLQPRRARFSETLEARISALAPRLSLNDRAELYSLLWNEESRLTQEWFRLALLLEQLGHPQHILAPASLVVDSFMLPVEGFLTPINPHHHQQSNDVQVCSLIKGVALPPLSVSQQDLARICAEVILTPKSAPLLSGVDLLDIPTHQLDLYTHRLQVDILLVCNAVLHVRETQTTADRLNRWIDSTQISGNDGRPGLIWAITSADSRFKNGVNLDEGVQRRVGTARTRWGTLQAQDTRNLHLLRDWLQGALTPERKTQRLAGLNLALEKQARNLFRSLRDVHLLTPEELRQQAEVLVRTLQTQVLQLGSLLACLVPSREALNQCWLQTYQQEQARPESPELKIDLFADEELDEAPHPDKRSYSNAIYHLWLNHLRTPLHSTETSLSSLLEPEQWHTLCEILIIASYRLGLPAQLESVSDEPNRELAVARSHSALGDFVAWLGYAGTPYNQRPLSRINKQQAIFAPVSRLDINQRLSKLGEQPQRTNVSYAYDWLVALYTRGRENSDYQAPGSLSKHHHQTLLKLLA
ncbi:virulence factor SrfC family protein [uncultured Cedecea sp.]|uniref:virulence factor SrfC family protein n=1 Tax=uncultured Cedecea sp. TaxID=988762 RepID=UPI0026345050|nr:virulence factor SrfC family protein [uncultured Cedecea sp.]